jgi:hypothetical protein
MKKKIWWFISSLFDFLAHTWKMTYHGMPSVLLWLGFWLMIWGQFIPALLVWILAELIQIKYHMEMAEIIVREEED